MCRSRYEQGARLGQLLGCVCRCSKGTRVAFCFWLSWQPQCGVEALLPGR